MDKVKNCADFASICSFLELFSEDLSIHISIPQLISSIVQVDAPSSPTKSEPTTGEIPADPAAESSQVKSDDVKINENCPPTEELNQIAEVDVKPESTERNLDKENDTDNPQVGEISKECSEEEPKIESQNCDVKEGATLSNGVNHSEEEDELEIFRASMSLLPLTPRLHKFWVSLHVRLLNKLGVRTQEIKWERGLSKFMALYVTNLSIDQYYSFESKGYAGLDVISRTKLLSYLLDYQFEKNTKFKEKVNSLSMERMRPNPLGIDVFGSIYWLFQDPNHNFLLYQDNPDDDTIKFMCETIHQLKRLLSDLKSKRDSIFGISHLTDNQPVSNESPEESIPSKIVPLPLLGSLYKRFKGESPSTSSAATTENSPRPENCQNGPEALHLKSDQETVNTEAVKMCVDDKSPDVNNSTSLPANSQIDTNDTSSKQSESPNKQDSPESISPSRSKPTPTDFLPDECQNDDLFNGVRRSTRQRKKVEIFGAAAEYSQSPSKRSEKKVKHSDSPSKASQESKTKEIKVKSKSATNRKPKKSDSDEDLPLAKLKSKSSKKGRSKTQSAKVERIKKEPEKKKKGRKIKSKGSKPWEGGSSDDDSEEPDFDHEFFVEEESESDLEDLNAIDNWTDAPESDFDEIARAGESSDEELLEQRGRNYARQKKRSLKVKPVEEAPVEETPCQVCGEATLPQWLLLCDECDFGFHTMCLRPALMIIPEGDWYCPRCQHKALINKLEEQIKVLSSLAAKKSTKLGIEERLNFVNISMTNILGDNATVETKSRAEARKVRYYSNSESGDYSDQSGSESGSSSSSQSSSEESVELRRATRQRRDVKYNYDEFDKIIGEAIEGDEKYVTIKKKKEKLKQKEIKVSDEEGSNKSGNESEEEEQEDEDEEDISDASAPKGKSRGKDMANILGPDWDKSDEDKPKPVVRRNKKKLTSNLSSNESNNEDDEEFHLSEEDIDSEEEAEEAKYRSKRKGGRRNSDESWNEDEGLSDESWSIRPKKETRYSSGRRSSRNKRGRHQKSKHKRRKSDDSDEDYQIRRPRRAATRGRVNYRAMEETSADDSEDSDADRHSPKKSIKKTFPKKTPKFSSDDEDYRAPSHDNSESGDEAIDKVIEERQAKKRKRIIESSSDESSFNLQNKRFKDEEEEEKSKDEDENENEAEPNDRPVSDKKVSDDEDIPECSDVLPELNESDLEAAEAIIDFDVDDNSNSNLYQPNLA